MRSWFTADDVAQQEGRRFLITGANAGLGFETARVLAARGAHVVLACRDAGRAETAMDRIRDEAPAAELSFQPLDLADLDQVREAAAAVVAGPRIDVLINNAGVMPIGPFLDHTDAAVRSAVEHVFAGQKHRMGLVVRTIGIARARIKIGMANLAYNFQRLAWLEGRTAPA